MRSAAGAAFGASFVAALLLADADLGHAAWYVSRASGLVLLVVLSASTLTGLLMTTRVVEPAVSRPLTFDLHQFLSSLALAFLAVHAGALLFDQFLSFSALALLVPFGGSYQAGWMALGIVSMWLVALVIAVSWYRSRLGQTVWRRVHYLSFLAYLLGVLHGFGAGPDSRTFFVYWLYSVAVAAVLALIAYRLAAVRLGTGRRVGGGRLVEGGDMPGAVGRSTGRP